jgi:hypothetical protein
MSMAFAAKRRRWSSLSSSRRSSSCSRRTRSSSRMYRLCNKFVMRLCFDAFYAFSEVLKSVTCDLSMSPRSSNPTLTGQLRFFSPLFL